MVNCKICGVKLTLENRYMSGKNKHRRMCKTCFNEQKKKYYEECTKKPPTIIMERVYTSQRIEFSGFFSRNEFLAMRRIQARFSKEAIGESSRCNQQVEHVTETEDKTTGDIHRTYTISKCDECGGTIRYDSHGDKVCEDCGLIDGVVVLEKLQYKYNYKNILPQDYHYKRATGPK